MDNYIPGVLLSPEDDKDYFLRVSANTKFPDTFYVDYVPEVKKQTYGTCAAQTISYMLERFTKKKMSAPFLYGYRRQMEYMGMGLYLRDLMHTVTKVGAVPEESCPVECEVPEAIERVNMNLLPLINEASKYMTAGYARITSQKELDFALLKGLPVAAVINIYNPILDSQNRYICPGIGGMLLHSVSVWGKDRPFEFLDSSFYRVLNTWGKEWGDGGWCWMSWEDLSRVGEMWVLTDHIGSSDEISSLDVFQRPITKFARGNDVRYVQQKLNMLGCEAGETSGIYNRFTECAVRMFKRTHKLTYNSIINKEMWEALDRYKDAVVKIENASLETFVPIYKTSRLDFIKDSLMNGSYIAILEECENSYKIQCSHKVGYINKKYVAFFGDSGVRE